MGLTLPLTVVAIDPGPLSSALVVLTDGVPTYHTWAPNDAVLPLVCALSHKYEHVAIEMIASYGMSVGAEVFETCVMIGRMMQVCRDPSSVIRVYRKDVKMHICGTTAARDSNIRTALLDRYGGAKAAKGCKAAPGPLYGFAKDRWAALAVAVTVSDRLTKEGKA